MALLTHNFSTLPTPFTSARGLTMQCSSIPGDFTPAALPWAAQSPHHPAPQLGSSPAAALQRLKGFFISCWQTAGCCCLLSSCFHAWDCPCHVLCAPLGTMGSSQVPKALLGLLSLFHGAFKPNRAEHSAMALGAAWGKVRRHFPPGKGLEQVELVGASPSDVTTLSSLESAVCTGQKITQLQSSGAGEHPGTYSLPPLPRLLSRTSPSQLETSSPP